jgi:hypothetical protein
MQVLRLLIIARTPPTAIAILAHYDALDKRIVNQVALPCQVEKRRGFKLEIIHSRGVAVDYRSVGTVQLIDKPVGQRQFTAVLLNPDPSQQHMRQMVPSLDCLSVKHPRVIDG